MAACVALLITDGGPASASCPSQCASPATWGQPFTFAGLRWERKSGCGGPGPNCWAPENAEPITGEGVRMRLTRRQGSWYSSEIRTTAPVANGGYAFHLVGRTDLLDPNVVLGIFLYDDAAGEAGNPCPAELDVESSRFGNPAAPNGHFVTYASELCSPADLGSVHYALNGTYTTHQIDWSPGAVSLRLMHGHRCAPELPEHVIGERTFVSPLVPAAGGMRLHVNLWAFAGSAPTDQQEVEIVVRDIVPSCVAVADAAPAAAPARELAVLRNPSRRGAELRFAIPADERVRVTILDVSGRRIATLADAAFPAGRHHLRWDPSSGAPGVYFARLEAGGRTVTRRMVVLE